MSSRLNIKSATHVTQNNLSSEKDVSKRKECKRKGQVGKENLQNKKVKHQKYEKKDNHKSVQSTTLEEAKQRAAEEKENKLIVKLLKKQEVEARKLEREHQMMQRKLQREIENKAKEERKKERERLRLEKKERAEEQKRLKRIEKERAEEQKRLEQIEKERVEEHKRLKQIKKEEQNQRAKLVEKWLMQQTEEENTDSNLKNEEAKPGEKSVFHNTTEEVDFDNQAHYQALLAAFDTNLVTNVESFECPICFMNIDCGKGVILHDCLHSFCKECLAGLIQHSDTAVVRCPFQNDEYACDCHLQDREIRYLVSTEIYEKHLQKSLMLAESQASNSFHCKTSDCPGWCLYEDNVNMFYCSICTKTNCLACAAIHEGKNCKQYQDYVQFMSDTNEEARTTKQFLQNMLDKEEAMKCPKCYIIIIKKDGCDALTCTMCQTEICWVTKGARWGPNGKGDISGGCRCNYNGHRCHPKCRNCH